MKKIEIKRMKLTYFKGIRDLEIEMGHRTNINGDNGTGKTTLFDACTWVLFGKDSLNRTDSGRGSFGIKTTNENGEVIEKLDHAVELTLSVNGTMVEVGRKLEENWVKKRGEAEAKMDGNTTHYYWDSVEVKKKEFDAKVSEVLIDENQFKMMTNPHHFSSLPWEEQLKQLNVLIGEVDLEVIASLSPAFNAEYQSLNGKSIDDRLGVLKALRKRTQEEMDNTTQQVKGMKMAMPERPNVEALQAEQKELTEKLNAIESSERAAAKSIQAAIKERNGKIGEINDMINNLRNAQREIINTKLAEVNKSITHNNAECVRLQGVVDLAIATINNLNTKNNARISNYDSAKRIAMAGISAAEASKQQLYADWEKKDAEVFQADSNELICPFTRMACGDANAKLQFHNDRIKSEEAFNTSKMEALANIERLGAEANNQIDKANELIKTYDAKFAEENAKYEAELKSLTTKRDNAIKAMEGLTMQELITKIDGATIPEYMRLEGEADKLEAEIKELNSDTLKVDDSNAEVKVSIRNRLNEIAASLGVLKVIEDNTNKIATMEARISECAQQKADAEQEEDVLNQMTRAIDEEIERRCQNVFSKVRFKTIEMQLNGGSIRTCYAMVDGVKYSDLNRTGKVNAGLDIINALCRYYDTYCPIFVDDAEGYNELEATDSQRIRLVVTHDNPMRVEIEEEI